MNEPSLFTPQDRILKIAEEQYAEELGYGAIVNFLHDPEVEAILSASSEKAPTEEALRDQITGLESTLDEQCRLAAEYSIRLSYIASMPDEDNEWDAVTKYQMARAIARNPMTEDK